VSAKLWIASENKALDPEMKAATNFIKVTTVLPVKAAITGIKPKVF